MRFKYILILIFFLYFRSVCFGQLILTLNEAIGIALKNNHSVLISLNEAEMARNSNTLGNAGFLPAISLNASGSSATNILKQEYISGMEIDRSGVRTNTVYANAVLSWTLFDGMKMFAVSDRLKEEEDIGLTNFRISIENTLFSVINSYYDVVRQKLLLLVIDSTLAIDIEKMKLAELKYNTGSGSKLAYLQARVDYNARKSEYLRHEAVLLNAKVSLNYLLSRNPGTEFEVDDSIPLNYNPPLSELEYSVFRDNNIIKFYKSSINLSDYTIREMKSGFYPKLDLTVNYNITRTKNQVGYMLLNQSRGWAPGFNATWKLFDGSITRTDYENSKLQKLNAELQLKDITNAVESDLIRHYRNFQNSKQILLLEEENKKVAEENLKVAIEKYRLGGISGIEFKEAENSYQEAGKRYINARYEAKIGEIELMRLSGALIK